MLSGGSAYGITRTRMKPQRSCAKIVQTLPMEDGLLPRPSTSLPPAQPRATQAHYLYGTMPYYLWRIAC